MRKSYIWILIILMAISFTGLLLLQVRYINQTSSIFLARFDDNVKRSLYQVIKTIDEMEVRDYLEELFYGETDDAKRAKALLASDSLLFQHSYVTDQSAIVKESIQDRKSVV